MIGPENYGLTHACKLPNMDPKEFVRTFQLLVLIVLYNHPRLQRSLRLSQQCYLDAILAFLRQGFYTSVTEVRKPVFKTHEFSYMTKLTGDKS